MTLPEERANAVVRTREFLRKLLLRPSQGGFKIPLEVRRQAKSLLKHYPGDFDIERAAKKSPEIFQVEARKAEDDVKSFLKKMLEGQIEVSSEFEEAFKKNFKDILA